MEQRAEAAGKDEAASIFRKFIEKQKRKQNRKMLRPNTELLKDTVMQEVPRYVDLSTGTLVGEDKKYEALRRSMRHLEERGIIR